MVRGQAFQEPASGPQSPVLLEDLTTETQSATSKPTAQLEQNKRKWADSFERQAVPPRSLSTPLNPSPGPTTREFIAEFLNTDNNCKVTAENKNNDPESTRKPGRKPFSEISIDDEDDPKVKRKLQNRAAQRAFRERKERYVRELEMKMKQIQETYFYTTTQLSQENQYLRHVVHQLESEICALKGIPLPPHPHDMREWQPSTTIAPPPPPTGLAPFLTIQPQPNASRLPVTIAPAPIHNNKQQRPLAPKPAAATVPLPEQPSSSPPPLITAGSSSRLRARSPTALYIQFSPEEQSLDDFNTTTTTATSHPRKFTHDPAFDDPYLYQEPIASTSSTSGSSSSGSSSRGSRQVRPSTDLKTGACVVAEGSTEKTQPVPSSPSDNCKVQLLWRRLNLYGRFTDFDFNQICKVAQMVDNASEKQQDAPSGPAMEDWEIDKLMHIINPDHI